MPEYKVTVSYLRRGIVTRRTITLLAADEEMAERDAIELTKIGIPPVVRATDFQIDECKKEKRHA